MTAGLETALKRVTQYAEDGQELIRYLNSGALDALNGDELEPLKAGIIRCVRVGRHLECIAESIQLFQCHAFIDLVSQLRD